MRWFCAITEQSLHLSNFIDMVKVAVYTARQNTSLKPYCIYDGIENEFTAWLTANGVEVVFNRIPFYDALRKISIERDRPQIFTFGAGAFLRTMILAIAEQRGFADETVLYTDCDVLFMMDVAPLLSTVAARYFAVAPESNQNDYYNINTGVMLMNLAGLSTEEKEFQVFLDKNLHVFTDIDAGAVYDQTAYEYYYRPITRYLMQHNLTSKRLYRLQYHLAKLRKPLWDKLPLEYNWKPYWGLNGDAKIVHFHGPKPCASSPDEHPHFRPPSFESWRAVWTGYFDNLPT